MKLVSGAPVVVWQFRCLLDDFLTHPKYSAEPVQSERQARLVRLPRLPASCLPVDCLQANFECFSSNPYAFGGQ